MTTGMRLVAMLMVVLVAAMVIGIAANQEPQGSDPYKVYKTTPGVDNTYWREGSTHAPMYDEPRAWAEFPLPHRMNPGTMMSIQVRVDERGYVQPVSLVILSDGSAYVVEPVDSGAVYKGTERGVVLEKAGKSVIPRWRRVQ